MKDAASVTCGAELVRSRNVDTSTAAGVLDGSLALVRADDRGIRVWQLWYGAVQVAK